MTETELPDDFDPEEYLSLHPDLRAGKVDPVQHYLKHGRYERRAYKRAQLALLPRERTPYDFDGLRTIHNHDFMSDPSFTGPYGRGVAAAGSDYKWYWRVHIGLWAARVAARLGGDFVECGVNRGFLSSAIMKLLDWDRTGKTFYLLDTFEGLDPRFVTEAERAAGILEKNRGDLESGFYTRSFEEVERNFAEWQNKRLVVGSIPETLSQVTSAEIAFLHIDLNCSPPEVAAIEAFWPRMPKGGIVLLDDYAYYGYQPQKDGMDAWARAAGTAVASLPTGQGLIVKT